MSDRPIPIRYDAVVIGAGQAGLAAGRFLTEAGLSFVILDAAQRAGDSWRQRWDSLLLFTPAQYDGLPGLSFPAPRGTFPTKDDMADYLESYAAKLALPIRYGARVSRVTRSEDDFAVEWGERRVVTKNVIVASGACARPRIPEFTSALGPDIAQLHSSDYHRPDDVPPGTVLVVGFGTSGAEIAIELASQGRNVMVSGRPTPHIPDPLLRHAGGLYWRFIHHVLTIDTPVGRKVGPRVTAHGAPLIRISAADVAAAGVKSVPRVAAVRDGRPLLENGTTPDIAGVVWCTGFRPSYDFLRIPSIPLDPNGWPVAPHGVVPSIPGLYFVGVPFQVGLTSALVGGMGRDAELVVRHLASRVAESAAAVSRRAA